MNNLHFRTILDRFSFFKENPIRSLTDLQKKVALFALAIFGLASIYLVYHRWFKKEKIDQLNPTKSGHASSAKVVASIEGNKTPVVTKKNEKPRDETSNTKNGLGIDQLNPTKSGHASSATVVASVEGNITPVVTEKNEKPRDETSNTMNGLGIAQLNPTKSGHASSATVVASAEGNKTPVVTEKTEKQRNETSNPMKGLDSDFPVCPPLSGNQKQAGGKLVTAIEKPLNPEVNPQNTVSNQCNEEAFRALWEAADNLVTEAVDESDNLAVIKKLENAEELFEEALKMKPEATLNLYLRGYRMVLFGLTKLKEFDCETKKEQLYKKMLAINPNDFIALEMYGEYLIKKKRFKEAGAVIKQVLETNPLMDLSCFGQDLNQCKIDPGLLERCNKAQKEEKGTAEFFSYYGTTPYEQGENLLFVVRNDDYKFAVQKLQEAMESDPKDDFAKRAYVVAFLKKINNTPVLNVNVIQEPESILARLDDCKKCLEICPNHPYALKIQKEYLERQKKVESRLAQKEDPEQNEGTEQDDY